MELRKELETMVAGCLLYDKRVDVMAIDIDENDFICSATKSIVIAAKALRKSEYQEIDPILIRSKAKELGIYVPSHSELSEIMSSVPTSAHYLHYINRLKQSIYDVKIAELRNESAFKLRNAEDVVELSKDIAQQEQALKSKYIAEPFVNPLPEIYAKAVLDIENLVEPEGLVKTHVDFIDELSGGGYLPNEFIVIAARPGSGKTALALQIMATMAKAGDKSSFFSLEMNARQVATRLIALTAKVNTKIVSRNPKAVNSQIIQQISKTVAVGVDICSNILIHDQADQSVQSIRAQARQDVENGAKAIFIDYLQLLPVSSGIQRNIEIGRFSNAIKNMAKELAVPVFVLSQLNRNIENEKRAPKLSDLRDSGAIEQDANVVLFIHPTGDKQNDGQTTTILQGKGRDTGTGVALTFFNTSHQTFYKSAQE